MAKENAETPIAMDFACSSSARRGSFTALKQRAMEYPFDSVQQTGSQVEIVLDGETHFSGHIDASQLAGTFKDSQGAGTFHLTHDAAPHLPYTEQEVVFHNGPVDLSGSLYVPRDAGLHPAVVMLQGSGPETRWGANRFWADYLARRGIACLIYDKRGAGKSTGDWKTADFEALAGDALAGVRFLQRQPGIDAKKIGIHGHSQGAAIAPLIASRSDAVAFVLADAASGVPIWQSEIYSQQSAVGHFGLSAAEQAQAKRFIEKAVQVERTGAGYDGLRAEYKAAEDAGAGWTKGVELPSESSYFVKFFPAIANYDPGHSWSLVNVPVLVVEAGEDERIPVDASVAAIGRALRGNGNPDFTVVVFPGTAHSFVTGPKPGEAFRWPAIAPGYADLLTSWVLYRMSSR